MSYPGPPLAQCSQLENRVGEERQVLSAPASAKTASIHHVIAPALVFLVCVSGMGSGDGTGEGSCVWRVSVSDRAQVRHIAGEVV